MKESIVEMVNKKINIFELKKLNGKTTKVNQRENRVREYFIKMISCLDSGLHHWINCQ